MFTFTQCEVFNLNFMFEIYIIILSRNKLEDETHKIYDRHLSHLS